MSTIHANHVHESGLDKAALVDVRSPGEYAGVHAEGAINIPLDLCSAEQFKQHLHIDDLDHIYLICQSGQRAQMAFDKLGQSDFALKLKVVDGGTTAWQESNLPVIKGKGVISIERQVRIIAGFLVALGVVLGYYLHPGFLGISAFVGAGLMFAGITDFCGMGIILAKMPWNNRKSCSIGCAAK